MLKEFREFALRGNVIDLAVGVVIGGAFGKLVGGIVEGIIEPIVAVVQSTVTKGTDLTTEQVAAQAKQLQDALWNGGATFGMAVFNFLILAAVVFFIFVKPMNKLKASLDKKTEAAGPPEAPADVKLLAEIRDLLKSKA